MKTQLKYIIIFSALTALLTSCSSDDNANVLPVADTFGSAELYFDNGVAGDALVLGTDYTNSNGENLTINRLNYIISKITFIRADGTEYAYPKEQSYFIISQEDDMHTIRLTNLPAGDYTQVRFGIGVDQDRYLHGETSQQSFWDLAAANNMTWTWSTGYRFINFEGTFTSPQTDGEKIFQVHQGSNTATDNYREVTLVLPNTARIRTDETPSIHIIADANVILDGTNKIKLYEAMNTANTGASIMGGEKLISIAANTLAMFTVDHVHNEAGNHHAE